MSAIGTMTRWMQPCAIGAVWAYFEPWTVRVVGWDGMKCKLYMDYEMPYVSFPVIVKNLSGPLPRVNTNP